MQPSNHPTMQPRNHPTIQPTQPGMATMVPQAQKSGFATTKCGCRLFQPTSQQATIQSTKSGTAATVKPNPW